MSELKSCPFCDARPEYSERADAHTQTGRIYFISCKCGGYSARAHQYADTYEEVVYLWNTRHPSEALPEPVAWEYRDMRLFGDEQDWGEWKRCTKPLYEQYKTGSNEFWAYEVRELVPRTKSPEAARVPDGWKLVPQVPTQEMVDEGRKMLREMQREIQAVGNVIAVTYIYNAMLSATPPQHGECGSGKN